MSIQQSSITFARIGAPACFALAIALFCHASAGAADTRVVGVAGSNSNTVLTREVEDLQARIKKLEREMIDVQRKVSKPDEPDTDDSDKPDKKSGGGKDSGNSAGSKESSSSSGGKPESTSNPGEGNLKDVFPVMTVRAPFVVVDSAGKTLLRVNDPHAKEAKGGARGVYIYGDAGSANLALTAELGGGRVTALSDNSDYSAVLNTISNNAGLKILKSKKMQSYVGLVGGTKPFIGVFSGDDSAAAGLQLAASGKGLVAVFSGDNPVAFLSQSSTHPGGGNVTTTDPGGNGVFSAGYTGDGGDACVNHRQGTHCLGAGLVPGLGIGQ